MQLANEVLFLCIFVQYGLVMPVVSDNCQGLKAKYKLTFYATWSSQTHPNGGFPSGAHFSSVVGASHDSNYTMWAPGILASTGVKLVAERGNRDTLLNEIDAEISKNTTLRAIKGPSNAFTTPYNLTNIDVFVTDDYPLVSVITMIAPSPDWFVGVHDLDLCGGKSFLDRVSREVFLYDSGTDSGTRFTSLNSVTNPAVKIFRITKDLDTPFKGDKMIASFGHMVFTKVEETYKNGTIFIPPESTTTVTTTTTPTPTTTTTTTTTTTITKVEETSENDTTFIPPESSAGKNFLALKTLFVCLLSLFLIKEL